MSEWISVKDRLPSFEDAGRSVATDPDYSEFVGVLDSYGDWHKAFYSFSRKEWIFSDAVAEEILLPVTDWIPIPPKDGEAK